MVGCEDADKLLPHVIAKELLNTKERGRAGGAAMKGKGCLVHERKLAHGEGKGMESLSGADKGSEGKVSVKVELLVQYARC